MTKHALPDLPEGVMAGDLLNDTVAYLRRDIVTYGQACAEAARREAIEECAKLCLSTESEDQAFVMRLAQMIGALK